MCSKEEGHPLDKIKILHTIPQRVCVLASANPLGWMRRLFFTFFVLLFSACATTPSVEDIRKAETHYKIGVSYLVKEQLHKAFVEFQKAIKLNPKNKSSLNAIGLILLSPEFKEYEEAIIYFKRAIAIDPNYSEAMNNLGVTYVEIENWEEAIKYFRIALRDPLYVTPERAYSNLGYAYYKKGDYLNAVNTLKKAIARYPDFPRSVYILGLVYLELGEITGAIDEFKKTVDIAPGYINARWELANAYLRIGDKENAVKHFKVIAESGSDNEKSKNALEYLELLKE
jgi:type IV pilus biogenesis/stability protein PilW